MQVIPAIDVLGGRCARLRRGDYESVDLFEGSPADAARRFCGMGARRIHVVDLDAAQSGGEENAGALAEAFAAAAEFGAQAQTGGGLRSMADIRRVLDAGAAFAILGTAAARNPEFLAEANSAFPGRIMLGVDARAGRVQVAGWQEEAGMRTEELLDAAHKSPPAAIVFTDIDKDGMMGGANVEATSRAAMRAPCPVIASGGVRGAEDVRALEEAEGGIAGAIIGRAAYETPGMLESLLQRYG